MHEATAKMEAQRNLAGADRRNLVMAIDQLNSRITTTQTASYATASTAAAFDGSKRLVSLANTGTGSNVLAASAALTGTPTLNANPIPAYINSVSTWDPANMPADGDVVAASVPCPGATVGMQVSATLSSIGANNVMISAHVESTDNLRVILMNKTGGAIDIGSGALNCKVWV